MINMKNKMINKKIIGTTIFLVSILVLVGISSNSMYATSNVIKKGSNIYLPSNNSCIPGTISGIKRIYVTAPEEFLEVALFIDGVFVRNGALSRAMCEKGFRIHVFGWDTKDCENGLHELQVLGENGEIVDSILILIQN